MNLQLMLGLREHIEIASHVPGHLRLKVGMGVIGNSQVIRYVKANGFGPPKGGNLSGIQKTSFNPLTRSMTMKYDKDVIEPKLLHRLFTSSSAKEFELVACQLAEVIHFDLETFLN